YLVILVILALVLVHGSKIKGATSWFVFPMGGFRLQFQPAEPCKIVTVLALSHFLAGRMLTFRKTLHTIAPGIILALPMTLILKQPDLGTAMVFVPTAFVIFFIAGLRLRVFVLFIALVAAAAYFTYPHLKPYQKDRIETFLNPGQDALGKGYNVIQAQTALGSGGFFGKGWGKGTQTGLRFLPEYQTDFVYPTLGEQFGFVGCMVILGLYGIMILRIIYVAGRVKDLFGVLALSGFATVFTVHLILNIGMATGLLPVTGLPLPFLSYGGSFMLTCYAMIGLIVSIGMRRELES
ncbi:rod shape-determining protein RodA, partial [Candidatus Sumerlaeota bacterium]|nr:rod shape-determining protein RodA [Candidatus Sumerlaeota bacterium]